MLGVGKKGNYRKRLCSPTLAFHTRIPECLRSTHTLRGALCTYLNVCIPHIHEYQHSTHTRRCVFHTWIFTMEFYRNQIVICCRDVFYYVFWGGSFFNWSHFPTFFPSRSKKKKNEYICTVLFKLIRSTARLRTSANWYKNGHAFIKFTFAGQNHTAEILKRWKCMWM